MTTQISIVGGPSREDLFDNLRLASIHRPLPLSFKVTDSMFSLSLEQILGIERLDKNPRTHEHVEWVIRAEDELPSDLKDPNDAMFQQYAVEMRYNIKTRKGLAVMTRIEGKTSKL